MAVLDPPIPERVLERRRRNPGHARPRQPPAHDRPIAAVDDRRQVTPPILSTEDVCRIDRPPHVRPLHARYPPLDARPLAARPLPNLPAVCFENPVNPLAVHGFAQLPPHEHRQPAQPVVGIRRDQPADQLHQSAIQFPAPVPFAAVVEGRSRHAEPLAQLRDRYPLALLAHHALYRQKAVSGFPDRAANFFLASSSSTSSPIFARSSRTSASCDPPLGRGFCTLSSPGGNQLMALPHGRAGARRPPSAGARAPPAGTPCDAPVEVIAGPRMIELRPGA